MIARRSVLASTVLTLRQVEPDACGAPPELPPKVPILAFDDPDERAQPGHQLQHERVDPQHGPLLLLLRLLLEALLHPPLAPAAWVKAARRAAPAHRAQPGLALRQARTQLRSSSRAGALSPSSPASKHAVPFRPASKHPVPCRPASKHPVPEAPRPLPGRSTPSPSGPRHSQRSPPPHPHFPLLPRHQITLHINRFPRTSPPPRSALCPLPSAPLRAKLLYIPTDFRAPHPLHPQSPAPCSHRGTRGSAAGQQEKPAISSGRR